MRLTRKILADRKGLAAAIIAVVALGSTAGITLGGFSATIVNPTNTFSSGTIQLEEGVAATTCFSTGTGSGGSVTAANTGTCSTRTTSVPRCDQVPGGHADLDHGHADQRRQRPDHVERARSGCLHAAAAADDTGYVGADTDGFCGKVDVTIAGLDQRRPASTRRRLRPPAPTW